MADPFDNYDILENILIERKENMFPIKHVQYTKHTTNFLQNALEVPKPYIILMN